MKNTWTAKTAKQINSKNFHLSCTFYEWQYFEPWYAPIFLPPSGLKSKTSWANARVKLHSRVPFGSKQILNIKIVSSDFFESNKILGQKILGLKKFWVQKKCFPSKRCWVQKKLVQKSFGFTRMFEPKNVGSKVFLTWHFCKPIIFFWLKIAVWPKKFVD